MSITISNHFRLRLQAYAEQHGASMAGALIALATRQLDQETSSDDDPRDRTHGAEFEAYDRAER